MGFGGGGGGGGGGKTAKKRSILLLSVIITVMSKSRVSEVTKNLNFPQKHAPRPPY